MSEEYLDPRLVALYDNLAPRRQDRERRERLKREFRERRSEN